MFRWAPNLLTGLRNHCTLRTAKRRSAVRHREKQRAKPEIVRKSGLASEFNKIAKMVSKSSKHGKTLKPFQCPFSAIVITFLSKPFIEMW